MSKLKVVTIGGGSSYSPELVEGFIKRYNEFPMTEFWLVDCELGKEKVAIIEAMKLMNEIESEVSGRVTKICVEDGQPVEYGQVLMYVE